MAKLELTINVNWKQWGAWEAIRDLVFQNPLDAADNGDTIAIVRSPSGKITATNTGSHLTRQDLILGVSSKEGRNSRGHKGEGMKIAIATLVRLGCKVQIASGDEVWTPTIEVSEKFGGAPLLTINTRSRPFANNVQVTIEGIGDEAWKDCLSRVIDSRVMGAAIPETKFSTAYGEVIADPAFAGRVFVGSLYVCDLKEENAAFGYNFKPSVIELDSDRKLADPWTLKHAIGRMFEDLSGKIDNAKLYDLFRQEGFESRAIVDNYYSSPALAAGIAAEHTKRTGQTFAAATAEQSASAGFVGLAAPVVGSAIAKLVGQVNPLDIAIKTRAKGPKLLLDRSELTADSLKNLDHAVAVLNRFVTLPVIQPCDFWLAGTMGEANLETGEIRIARHVLDSLRDTIATLIHEYAHVHMQAGDGDAAHQRCVENTAALVIAGLMD